MYTIFLASLRDYSTHHITSYIAAVYFAILIHIRIRMYIIWIVASKQYLFLYVVCFHLMIPFFFVIFSIPLICFIHWKKFVTPFGFALVSVARLLMTAHQTEVV